MLQQSFQPPQLTLALLALLIRRLPLRKLTTQPIMVIGNRPEELVAAESQVFVDVICIRRLGKRWRPSRPIG